MQLLTLSEMADVFQCSAKTFSKCVREDNVPFVMDGKRMLFNERAVLDHLDSRNACKNLTIPTDDYEGGFVYLLQADRTSYFKIGYSERTTAGRIRQPQSGCPFELVVRATRPGDRGLERDLHIYFAKSRLRNEWFEIKQHWSNVVLLFLDWDASFGERMAA